MISRKARGLFFTVACLFAFFPVVAQAQDAHGIKASAVVSRPPARGKPLTAIVRLDIPDGTYVYASEDKFFTVVFDKWGGLGEPSVELSPTGTVDDSSSADGKADVFTGQTKLQIRAPLEAREGEEWHLGVSVTFQACAADVCFPPDTAKVSFNGIVGGVSNARVLDEGEEQAIAIIPEPEPPVSTVSSDTVPPFEIAADISGFQSPDDFIAFLERGRTRQGENKDDIGAVLQRAPLALALLLILVFGLALNLTPCVLPMVPVNLAIIGAGAQAASRGRGFLLGALYGLSMALTYGVLGGIAVLGGGTFGGINASPVFNLVIAVLFAVLGTAALDVFTIDFSRLGGSGVDARKWRKGSLVLPLVMGSVTAVLAGACVAPVVIAVVLLSAREYAAGNIWALGYPFALGLGMGLPWPFAGMGLSLLPKPGTWMKWVKVAFAVCFFGLAVYYGSVGVRMLLDKPGGESSTTENTVADEGDVDWLTSLPEALREATNASKPVLVDVGAPWCKACHLMQKTTLKDEDVVEKLAAFVPVHLNIKNPDRPDTKALMNRLGVVGFPTYLVLYPAQVDPSAE